jgi:hypothetical protein
MDRPPENLENLYNEWRRATDAEGRAIQAGDWPAVDEWQQCKAGLRDRILPAAEKWQNQWSRREVGQVEFERTFRPIVSELIALEHRNHAWLRERRESALAELRGLQGASRNLRGVHRAYGADQPSHWQSYS